MTEQTQRGSGRRRRRMIAYLAVMFTGVFLLLLLSYFMERRGTLPEESPPTVTINQTISGGNQLVGY